METALLLLVAAGFLLRVQHLEAQSLWYDEAISANLVLRPPGVIASHAAADIHPPLYYLALKGWTALAGRTELGLRSLSAFAGTLLLAVAGAVGLRLLGPSAALGAVLLAALSPFLVYYSQEARMYMTATLLGALSVQLYLGAPRRLGPRHLGLAAAAAAAAHSHYFAASVPLFLGAHALQRRRWDLLASLASGGLLFVPWLVFARGSLSAWPAISDPPGLVFLLRDLSHVWLTGPHLRGGVPDWGAVSTAGLLLAVLATPLSGSLLALYLWGPVGLLYLLSLDRPLYDPKFLLVAAPAFFLVLASPLARRGGPPALARATPPLGWLAVVLLAAGEAAALPRLQGDPALARDDYRGIARTIEDQARPGDAILLNAPTQVEALGYYYRGELPAYPLPRLRPPDAQATLRELETIARRHDRLWTVLWASEQADPQGLVEGWLDREGFAAREEWFGNVRLVLYALPGGEEQAWEASARFDQAARLVGYRLAPAPPGDVLRLTLQWEVLGPTSERYKVFVHLLDAQGQLLAQRDQEPLGGSLPTTHWRPGERLEDRYGIELPAQLPPGRYRLAVGLYSLADGSRLLLDSGEDHVILGPVLLKAAP